MRRRQFDWAGEWVHLRDFAKPVSHRKLPLGLVSNIGTGTFHVDRL